MPAGHQSEAVVERSNSGWRFIALDGDQSGVTFYRTKETAVAAARVWLGVHCPGRLLVRDATGETEELWEEIPGSRSASWLAS